MNSMSQVSGTGAAQPLDTNKCPDDLESFVEAVNEGKVHVVATDFGYHVHVGSKDTMRPRAYGLMMGGVAVSGDIVLNSTNNWLTLGALKIPLQPKRVAEAVKFCKTTDYEIQADSVKKVSVVVKKIQ